MNNKKILRSAIEQCDLHTKRIETALKHIHQLAPFTPQKLSTLKDEEIAFLELLTSRLAKLQDTIGQKIFPNILTLLQEDISNKSFIDILNKLEKLGFLDNVEHWKHIREIRNAISHDYPEHPQLVADNLNQALTATQELLTYWHELRQQLEQRVLKKI